LKLKLPIGTRAGVVAADLAEGEQGSIVGRWAGIGCA
jgi:hypothetical protein